MKKICKRCLALLFAILMTVVSFGTSLPKEVSAASTTTENPEYMAKINNNYSFTTQRSDITPGKTYTVAFEYYSPEAESITLYLWSNAFGGSNVAERLSASSTAGKGTLKITYTAAEDVNHFFIRIQENKGNNVYIWNVRLMEEGSTENLLTNGDFSQGWNGYLVGGSWRTTAAIDEVCTDTNGACEIVPYDEKVHTPAYMLKLTGTEDQTSWIYQLYSDTKDNTEYVFSCDYYVPEDCDTHGKMWGANNVTSSLFSKGRGTMTMSYTTIEGDGGFHVGFQASSQVECYVWNLSLKEKGSTTELLNNAYFSGGLLTGWTTTAGTVAQVLPYDEKVETPAYMLKMKGTEDKTNWLYQLYGNTNDNTEYVFSCDYYVPEDCDTHGKMWGGAGNVTSSLFSKGRGTMTMSLTTLENDGGFYVGFQASSQVECYVWNLSLKEKGSTTELLNNAYFSGGLLTGWTNNQNNIVAQVIPYDENVDAGRPLKDITVNIDGPVLGKSGATIGWQCSVGGDDKADITELGMIVTLKQYVTAGSLSKENMTETIDTSYEQYIKKAYTTDVDNIVGANGSGVFYANVSNIPEDFYGTRYIVRVYAKDSTGNIYYSTSTADDSKGLSDDGYAENSLIRIAKEYLKYCFQNNVDGITDVVSAYDTSTGTLTYTDAYNPSIINDNGAKILEWLQTNAETIENAMSTSDTTQ